LKKEILFTFITLCKLIFLKGVTLKLGMFCFQVVLQIILTLLSLSNSLRSHSKSLYLLLTVDSFSLKIGRFV
jgi:hypothetical protein